ncbi:carbohydrate ABC transporter permease (plasmid) [Rhizobium sp. CB3090]|uniref:carbohydrate ABC transporter permease n=1 Tax=Rhizobium sp. CB3090 TaxID=3039156 RepID=UPI0024B16456|nr:carbohydrate ABC transporter permease [Rhizobium sp. CB3090]WFU12878.1 carbohydrate ABC transporter permease [Rhizobium sp. CB3090]
MSEDSTFSWGRLGIYAVLIAAAAFYLLPLYVMVVTSLKTMPEIRDGNLFALPHAPSLDAWRKAWTTACTGLACDGIQVGFRNSVNIVLPSVLVSIFVGALNGYALVFWNPRGGVWLFCALLVGAFVPYQVFIYPLTKMLAATGLFKTLSGLVFVHTIFGMPIMTMLFRNYFSSLPVELFNAARVDGAGFLAIFFQVMLPLSTPIIIVAVIMQVTGIWNDFLFGLVFGSGEGVPMTVQLNNIVNSTTGEREYNVNMAATILTSLVPLVVYLMSGKYFVRGIAAGAVKG